MSPAKGGSVRSERGPIERRGLRDAVYDRILEQLLRGDVAAGGRLSIDTLARQLDVSPTPVREALVQLERTGLVTREALRGYRVAPPLGPEQLAELFEARLMLETTAVRLAMTRAVDAAELGDRLVRAQDAHGLAGERLMRTMTDSGPDVAAAHDYFTRDYKFHAVFFEFAGNRYLEQMSASLGALTHRLRQAVRSTDSDVREAIREHEAVRDAARCGDVEAACTAMSDHIRAVSDRSVGAASDTTSQET